MIKVITFDLDDTLWDARPVLFEAERAVYEWLTVTCPAAAARHSPASLRNLHSRLAAEQPELTHQITASRRMTLQFVLQQAGVPLDHAGTTADEGIAVFLEARHQVELYAVVEPMLAKLADNFILGALTNGNADVHRLEIGRYFTFAFSAEMLNSSKPQSAHFEHTEHITGAAAAQILHVGDHIEHDVQPAHQRGWRTIWVRRDSSMSQQAPPGTAVIDDVNDLPATVQRLTQLPLPRSND